MDAALHIGIAGIGLLGPGLANWAQGRSLMRDAADWVATRSVVPPALRLPPNERRRAGELVRASIVVADEACAMAGIDPATLATVFSSSTGDPANCHAMCEALAQPARVVSPTRFTNSVHNAAAGYWHIATHSRQASTSLCAFDSSFAAGLIEAATQCLATEAAVLLVACDLPYPEPLNAIRTVSDMFALALVLTPPSAAARARIEMALGEPGAPTYCEHTSLEQVRLTIPAARALPLLHALSLEAPTRVSLALQDGLSLQLNVRA